MQGFGVKKRTSGAVFKPIYAQIGLFKGALPEKTARNGRRSGNGNAGHRTTREHVGRADTRIIFGRNKQRKGNGKG